MLHCLLPSVQVFPTQHVVLRGMCRCRVTLQLLGYALSSAPAQMKVGGLIQHAAGALFDFTPAVTACCGVLLHNSTAAGSVMGSLLINRQQVYVAYCMPQHSTSPTQYAAARNHCLVAAGYSRGAPLPPS